MIRSFIWSIRVLSKVSRKLLLLNFISSTLDGVSPVIYGLLLGYLVDSVIRIANGSGEFSDILPMIIIMFIYYIINGFARVASHYVDSYFRPQLYTVVFNLLFEKLDSLGVEQTEKPEIQNKITRYKDNSNLFYAQFVNFTALFSNIAAVISAIVTLLVLLPLIVPIVITLLIPKILTNRYFLRQVWETDKIFTPEMRMSNEVIQKVSDPTSFKEIYLSNATPYFIQKFLYYRDKYVSRIRSIRTRWYLYLLLFRITDAAITTIGLLLTINLVINNQISIGQMTFVISSIITLRGVLDTIIFTITNLSEGNQRLRDSKELFDIKTTNKITGYKLEQLPPIIEFRNVYFKYPGSKKFVLKNLNFVLNPGEKIAIVGHNGAGKTTMIKLLTKIYQPTKGEILINGMNLKNFDQKEWYENLGVLFQDYNTYGFLNTQDNVFVGNISTEKNESMIKKSLNDADALDFVENYPDKLDTILSEKYEGGIRPSTGQWQKIAIARFFYRNSPVLILDEPTASIDAVSEASIFDNIYEFIKNKTVIIVSHRFSTVRNADRIIVIDSGEIVENGTHSELLQQDGYYSNAFKLQAKGYGD